MDRPENITKLLDLEIKTISELADKLFDTFTDDTKKNITTKQAFILGFLHGREKLMDEMGLFDDMDDDSNIYAFLERNLDKNSSKR